MADVKNLTVRYGKTTVLDRFSAHFPDGAVTAVSGRSGCGKTTLLSVILGLLWPAHGQVSGFGDAVAVFQEDRLLPHLTAVKNITVTSACTEQAAQNALLQVGFDPQDLEKTASALSGGMARRVAIVRAMLANSDTVILDEPFKGLDEATRAAVVRFVRETRRGRTVILVTHDPRDAEDLGAAHHLRMG